MNNRLFLIGNFSALVFLLVIYMVFVYAMNNPYNWVIPVVLLGYSLLNVFLYNMLISANTKSPSRFITAFTGVVGIKLMSALIFLLVYMLSTDSDPIPVVAAVFLAYVTYTIVLIRTVLTAIRPK